MRVVLAFVISLSPCAALAQQADPAFMQKAIEAVANQRNAAFNQAAACEANTGKLGDELKKAQERIKELETKYEPKNK